MARDTSEKNSAVPPESVAALLELLPPEVKERELMARFLAAWLAMGWQNALAECGMVPIKAATFMADAHYRRARAAVEEVIADRHEARVDAITDGKNASAVQLNALMFRLRGLRSARYAGQRVEVSGPNGGPVQVDDGSASRAVEMLARFAASRLPKVVIDAPALPLPGDAAQDALGGLGGADGPDALPGGADASAGILRPAGGDE